MSVLLLVLGLSFFSVTFGQKSYDIENVYTIQSAESGTKVITGTGNVVSASYILSPTQLDYGTYTVRVTRKGQDIYLVEGYGIIVETRYCYEYSYSQKAVLKIKSSYGYSLGELIFIK